MANNTNFSKPAPPGKSRTKKRHSRKIPSPALTPIAITSTQAIPSELLVPSAQLPPKYRRKRVSTPNTYRYQRSGPPQRQLPTKKLPQMSQTPTPLTTQQKAASKQRSPQLRPISNAANPPFPGLEMSMTAHVGSYSQPLQNGNRNKHLNYLNQPGTTMKKTVSANDMADYVPVSSHYNNGHNQSQQHAFIPPPPPPQHNNRRTSQKRKHSKNKHNKAMPMFDTQMQRSHSNEHHKPSINTMKELIQRAETFGQTQSYGDLQHSANQIHSNQAPQIPSNNSIFDNSDSENNVDAMHMEHMEHKESYNNERNGELPSRPNVHLPSCVVPPPSMMSSKQERISHFSSCVVPPPSMTSMKQERMSQLKSTETQITNLKNEIDELQLLLNGKKQQLTILEKEKLENIIDNLKPISLLKKLNEFCQVANGEELDMLQAILSQSIK